MRRIVLVSVVALAVSCKRDASFNVELAAIKVFAQQRVERVMRQPKVNAAVDRLVAAIAADPQLRERGTALLTSLAADPTVSRSVQQLLGAAQSAPEVQRAVRELVKSHPGASASA